MSTKNSDQKPKYDGGPTLSRYAHDMVHQGVFKLPADPHGSPPKSPDSSRSLSEDESLTASSVNGNDSEPPRARSDRGFSSRTGTDLSFWTTARGKQLEGKVMAALNGVILEKMAQLQPSTVQYVVDRVLPELERIVAEVMDQEEEDEWVRCG